MVGEIDDRLFTLLADEFHLVLGRQDSLGRAALFLLAGRIPNADLDRPGISLLGILTQILEEQSIATVVLDGMRAIKHPLPPTLLAAVQGIGAIILQELIFTPIEVLNDTILDAIRDTADGGSKVRGVVVDIVVLRGEAEHDVLAADAELLDDGAQGQEGELCLFGGGHGATDALVGRYRDNESGEVG